MELLRRRVRPGSQLIYFCEHSLPFDAGPLIHSDCFCFCLFSQLFDTVSHWVISTQYRYHHCHCHYYCDHQYHHCYYHYYITIFTIIAAITSLISFTALASFTTRLISFIRLTLSTSFHLGLLFSSYWLFCQVGYFHWIDFFQYFHILEHTYVPRCSSCSCQSRLNNCDLGCVVYFLPISLEAENVKYVKDLLGRWWVGEATNLINREIQMARKGVKK